MSQRDDRVWMQTLPFNAGGGHPNNIPWKLKVPRAGSVPDTPELPSITASPGPGHSHPLQVGEAMATKPVLGEHVE